MRISDWSSDVCSSDLSTLSRDYLLDLDAPSGQAPLLSVFGGKITTFRRLAEQAVTMLQRPLGIDRPAWTGRAPLPGGEMPADGFDAFLVAFAAAHPWLPAPLAGRYAPAYGPRADRRLGGAASLRRRGGGVRAGDFA